MSFCGSLPRTLKRVGVCVLTIAAAAAAPALGAVQAGDQLQVTVYNAPDLSRKVTVDAAGTISLPLAGNVNVRGLETQQAEHRIERALNPYFTSKAAVNVEMLNQVSSLFVSGGPGGVLKYEPGETLVAALASLPGSDPKVTGITALAHSRVDLHRVGITRNGTTLGPFDALALSSRGENGPDLLPGDTISLIDKPNAVHVQGDVTTPGITYVSPDQSLDDALTQAGGVRDTAASGNVTLQRDGATQIVALGAPALQQPAHDGDVLTIATAPRVSVVGGVSKPGLVTLKNNFTLLNALYEAGGPVKRADLAHVQVMHAGLPVVYNVADFAHGNVAQNPVLTDGDLVFIPEGHGVDYSQVFQALVPLLYLVPKF